MPEKANDNNKLWEMILTLKRELPFAQSAFYLSFSINYNSDDFVISEKSQIPDPDRILISYNLESNDGWALNVSFSENLNWPVFVNNSLPEDQLIFIKRYLPFVLIKLKSYRRKSAYAIGHLAMSLDGKIATITFKTKIPGAGEVDFNKENTKVLLNDGLDFDLISI